MNPKQRAAEAALSYVRNDTVVGLGTGSTADFFIVALGDALRIGALRGIRGVPTSRASEQRAREVNIPIVALAENIPLDVAVDGADEIDPSLNLIKGLGGALLREKIIAQNARQFIVIADTSKNVPILGSKAPLPVEVASFEHHVHEPFLRSLDSDPILRKTPGGSLFTTDNGNVIYDCRFAGGIADPEHLLIRLRSRAGIVDCGLFLAIATVALIADEHRVTTQQRQA